MKQNLDTYGNNIFESIKHTDLDGSEFWSARELAKVLNYLEFRNFIPVIDKAKDSCKNSNQKTKNHFVHFHDMVSIGSATKRRISDIKLSRYACYLIVQNADPNKAVVALGQTYFAY